MTTREALEAALVATPDDVVLHCAYADFLIEQGDPRGEFIRLQLAAEDRNQPASRLRELEQAAFDIRQQHEQEWLGDLWPHVQRPLIENDAGEPIKPNVSTTWRRGWIDGVRVRTLSNEIVKSVALNPHTRLLSELAFANNVNIKEIVGEFFYKCGGISLSRLQNTGRFLNLRKFCLGHVQARMRAFGEWVHHYVIAMPRLEDLRVYLSGVDGSAISRMMIPSLRNLYINLANGNQPSIPIATLGANESPRLERLHIEIEHPSSNPLDQKSVQQFFLTSHLKELQFLTIRIGEFADAGVEELLASGFINRLKGLDLCQCNITDDGARMLAAHPHVPKLEYLHLDGNLLSPIGIEALEAVGVPVSTNQVFAQGRDE